MNKEIDLKQIAPYLLFGLALALLLYFKFNYLQKTEQSLLQNSAKLQTIVEQRDNFKQIQESRVVLNAQGERASFAQVQKILSENNLNNNIRQIEPSSNELDLVVEERINLILQDLDLKQVTDLLYAIEVKSSGLTIESLNISKNTRNFLNLDLSLMSQVAK